MLQRLQSVLLFLISVCMLMSAYWPLWEKVNPDTGEKFSLKTYGMLHFANGEVIKLIPFPYAFIGIFTVLVALVALYELFQYKNRLLQMKLGALNSLLMTITLGGTAFLGAQLNNQVLQGFYGNYKPGIAVVMVAMVLNIIANRFIRRDENLVRSADRIR